MASGDTVVVCVSAHGLVPVAQRRSQPPVDARSLPPRTTHLPGPAAPPVHLGAAPPAASTWLLDADDEWEIVRRGVAAGHPQRFDAACCDTPKALPIDAQVVDRFATRTSSSLSSPASMARASSTSARSSRERKRVVRATMSSARATSRSAAMGTQSSVTGYNLGWYARSSA